MTALPSALACQVSRPSRSEAPRDWTAKSTMLVVPPNAAARVPVSKVSFANVPPNGSSMWVWTSMPPGMTYLPVASIVSSAVAPPPARSWPMLAIVSPSIRMSATYEPSAVTIVPLVMSVRIGPSWRNPRHPAADGVRRVMVGDGEVARRCGGPSVGSVGSSESSVADPAPDGDRRR